MQVHTVVLDVLAPYDSWPVSQCPVHRTHWLDTRGAFPARLYAAAEWRPAADARVSAAAAGALRSCNPAVTFFGQEGNFDKAMAVAKKVRACRLAGCTSG